MHNPEPRALTLALIKRGDLTGAKRLETRTGWDQIVHAIEKIKKQKWETFQIGRGAWREELEIYLGRRDAGMTLKQLGEAAGGVDFRTVSWAIAQFEKRLPNNKHLGKLIANIRCTTQNPEL